MLDLGLGIPLEAHEAGILVAQLESTFLRVLAAAVSAEDTDWLFELQLRSVLANLSKLSSPLSLQQQILLQFHHQAALLEV